MSSMYYRKADSTGGALPSIATSSKRKQKRTFRWLLYTCLAPFIVLLTFVGWFGWNEFQSSKLLRSELQRLERQGSPFDNPSMQRWYDSRTHKEGTEAWLEVLELTKTASQLGPDLPFVGNAYIPLEVTVGMEWPSEPKVAEFLEMYEPVIQKITAAGQFPKPVWLPIGWNGVETLLPELTDSRSVVQLLSLKALHSLWNKDTKAAMDAMQSMKDTAESFDSHACFVSDSVCMGARVGLYHMINLSMSMDVWSEQELEQLEDLLKPFSSQSKEEFSKLWEATLSGEREMVLTLKPSQLSGDMLRYYPIFPSDSKRILDHYQSLIDLGKEGLSGLQDRCVNQTAIVKKETDWFPSASSLILRTVSPTIETCARAIDRTQIMRQVTLSSLAIKRFQKKNGKFPETLSELDKGDWPIPDWNINGRKQLIYAVIDNGANLSYPDPLIPSSMNTLELGRNFRIQSGMEVVIR
jgi:hypothetical protein